MADNEENIKEKILEALKNVIDPEVGLNVVEMGLIKDISFSKGKATIKMTLTVPSFLCPLARYLVMQVRKATLSLPEVKEAEVILIEPYQL